MDDSRNAGPASPSSTPAAPPRHRETIKETIESILVAFILAFVFRAFIVEAFVIPSGSMAPTLLGGHMRFTCEACGYQFDLNYPGDTSSDDVNIPSVSGPIVRRRGNWTDQQDVSFSTHCANCGLKVSKAAATNPPVHYGDRILVLKYLYLLQDPRRWDVVVFKSPSSSSGSSDFTQNFIKRLVGRPGETLMLLDGDVYVCPNEKADGDKAEWPWQVQTKPRVVQDALWRVVYDNDHYPRKLLGWNWTMPWQAPSGEKGWLADGIGGPGRILKFDNPDGAARLVFNKDANKGAFPLTDWLPYDETHQLHRGLGDNYDLEAYGSDQVPRWYVSDLKVQFAYQRQSGDGAMRATLTKLGEAFTAELKPGLARVLHRRPSGETVTIGEATLEGDGPCQVEFTNLDYRVTLRVNGKDRIQTTPAQYRPDVRKLLDLHETRTRTNGNDREAIRSVFAPPTVELQAERQRCEVSHLSLWRDIYYTPTSGNYYGPLAQGGPDNPVRLHRKGDIDRDGNKRDGEYFVLGDNSILSSDARMWTQPVHLREDEDLYAESGRVPDRFLLGKAFFVYWPAGYRPITNRAPGMVPNFGEMRFIH